MGGLMIRFSFDCGLEILFFTFSMAPVQHRHHCHYCAISICSESGQLAMELLYRSIYARAIAIKREDEVERWRYFKDRETKELTLFFRVYKDTFAKWHKCRHSVIPSHFTTVFNFSNCFLSFSSLL